MHRKLIEAAQNDFLAFAELALRELDGTNMSDDEYLELLATRLVELQQGSIKKLLINLPPRHLKTQLCTVCFSAWLMAHQPNVKIMIVTYSERLAKEIAHSIRSILRAPWYRKAFKTRVAKDHAQVDNFRTTDGGHVYAASFDGSLTGFGADVIIVDDAHNQSDAGFPRKLERTIEKFHGLVIGRLNNPKNGRVLVVGHRIHECDLSADLIANGGWTHVALPAIARQKKRYKTNYGDWRRRKGQTLRADTPRADFERLGERLVNPPFELLYLQGCGEQLPSIKAEHFKPFDKARVENLPHFLSVDAASKDGSASSFSVVQLWASDGSNLFLVNQFREQCDFARLSHVVRNLARHYNGVPILIEDTANGCALLSDLRKRNIHAIVPSGSKEARFRPHLEKIIAGKVHVPANAPFAREFMKEFLEFPHGEYNDQVDAFSQFAGWIEDRRDIDFSRKNFSVGGLGVIARDSDPPSGVPSAAYPQSGNPARGLIAIARPQRHPFFPTRR